MFVTFASQNLQANTWFASFPSWCHFAPRSCWQKCNLNVSALHSSRFCFIFVQSYVFCSESCNNFQAQMFFCSCWGDCGFIKNNFSAWSPIGCHFFFLFTVACSLSIYCCIYCFYGSSPRDVWHQQVPEILLEKFHFYNISSFADNFRYKFFLLHGVSHPIFHRIIMDCLSLVSITKTAHPLHNQCKHHTNQL